MNGKRCTTPTYPASAFHTRDAASEFDGQVGMGVPLEVQTESALQGEVVRNGPGHWGWPNEIKGRIVAETLAPGVLDSAV